MRQTGDILFAKGKGFISNGIKLVTKSEFTHVGAFYSTNLIFETHQKTNAKLSFFQKEYKNKEYVCLRTDLTEDEKQKFKNLVKKYDGTKYSGWDIFTNFVFAWLPSKARRKTVSFLGKKSVMICSELIGRILYEIDPSKFFYLKDYEGNTPYDLYKILLKYYWKNVSEVV